jgi:uncharacterized membrane protein HdeD (DUF308 family)
MLQSWWLLSALAALRDRGVAAIMGGVFEIIAAFHLRRELGNEWLLTLNAR